MQQEIGTLSGRAFHADLKAPALEEIKQALHYSGKVHVGNILLSRGCEIEIKYLGFFRHGGKLVAALPHVAISLYSMFPGVG